MDVFDRINETCSLGSSTVDDTLQRIMKVCRELIVDRGYGDEVHVNGIRESALAGSPVIQARGSAGEMHIFFHAEERVGIKFIRALDEAYGDGDRDVLVLSVLGPTAYTKKDADGRHWLQMLVFKDMYVNVTRHCLVPKHRKMDSGEVAELRRKYRLSDGFEQLPKLFVTDPVAKYFRFTRGDIIHIDRPSGPYYRVVV